MQNSWWQEATPRQIKGYRPWEDRTTSLFWKNMGKTTDVLNCSISFQLGNGEIIKFWHDRWLDQPLKLTFSYLYNNYSDIDRTVAEVFSNGTWNLQVETHITQEITSQYQQLMNKLIRIMVQRNTTDLVIWEREIKGFTVKSYYQFVQRNHV
jgi:hypothetical protein